MDDNKKISVIVPVYNTEEYLAECFDSIFGQTVGDIEVIAIDDGSTDGSFQKLQEIQKAYSDLAVKTQKNIGLGATRNIGIRETTGKYIYFMDSDDIIEADFFEKSLKILEKTGADFVGFQADIFGDTDGKDKRQYMYVDNYLSNLEEYNGVDFQKKYHWVMPLYNIPFCIFRRSFIENNSLYFMEGVLHEDTEFYWHMMTFNPKFVLSREVMYHRRYRHDSIMTGTNWEYRFKSKLQVYKKISEEANEKLRDVYLYYAISSIDKTFKEDNDRVLQLDDDNCRFIADLLSEIIEKSSELSILHEVFLLDVIEKFEKMGFRFRNEDVIKKEFKNKIFGDLFLSKLFDEKSFIAVYGTGVFSSIILDMIKNNVGNLKASITYIDSFVTKGDKKFQGNDVYNFREVNIASFDLIIVMSELYEEEMCGNLIGMGIDDKIIGMRRYLNGALLGDFGMDA